jgi:ornithine carbamoyltransferase
MKVSQYSKAFSIRSSEVKNKMNHLLSIEELSKEQIEKLIDLACALKKDRKASPQVLNGQQWALIFTKSSTRTRVSFEVGIRELGGQVMFLSSSAAASQSRTPPAFWAA